VKLKGVYLRNFKRFTDLSIEEIPATSKLVLLIGANGSGKSCVFDAFNFCSINHSHRKTTLDYDHIKYYFKSKDNSTHIDLVYTEGSDTFNRNLYFPNKEVREGYSEGNQFHSNVLYGRTSFRQLSRINKTNFWAVSENKILDNPQFFIDRDHRFENDLENIYRSVLKDVFKEEQSSEKVKEKYIQPINRAFENIFGDPNGTKLKLLELIPPLDGKIAQVTFQKGAHQFHYNYLSAGEKEVFNILINLLSRSPQYQNTVYYIDELDLHLNTKLQFNLIKEITENWIPENCQLWTASHSLGFIEYARQSEQASIIDFDDLDFDLPQVLTPVPKENPDVYEIAIGKEFLPALFKDMQIIFVENKDKQLYGSIGLDKTVFVSEKDKRSVYYKTVNTDFFGLVDRDWLSDDDIRQIKEHYPQLYVPQLYSIENYLYHPDNLQDYFDSVNKPYSKESYINNLIEEKNVVVNSLIARISSVRNSYPFFKEPESDEALQKRFKPNEENYEQTTTITKGLQSDQFEIFYPFLPMKDYCTNLRQRQNMSKTSLAKTNWFKKQIEDLIK